MALKLYWIAILLTFKWIRTDLTILGLINVLKNLQKNYFNKIFLVKNVVEFLIEQPTKMATYDDLKVFLNIGNSFKKLFKTQVSFLFIICRSSRGLIVDTERLCDYN